MIGIGIDEDNINAETGFNELEVNHIDHVAEFAMKRLLNDKANFFTVDLSGKVCSEVSRG